jgi:two-component system LytT family sensor kinase
VRTDPDAAERVLAQLGELLRAAVTHSRTHEVTLREELETLEPFLAVAQARLGQRLEVWWDVDEALLDARVPHMILQPLVENAVKHGLAPRRATGHIEVAARRGAGRLELSVPDDGVGLESYGYSLAHGQRGLGLANTRARLTELYGGAATLELMSSDRGGTVARLSVPWQEVAAPLMHRSFAPPTTEL